MKSRLLVTLLVLNVLFTVCSIFGMQYPAFASGASVRRSIVSIAQAQLGKPYVWAAAGPDSFDCRGLVYWCYSNSGVTEGLRDVSSLWPVCDQLGSKSDLLPGDLVFYSNLEHVGIWIGNDQIIDAEWYTTKTGVEVKVVGQHAWGWDVGWNTGRFGRVKANYWPGGDNSNNDTPSWEGHVDTPTPGATVAVNDYNIPISGYGIDKNGVHPPQWVEIAVNGNYVGNADNFNASNGSFSCTKNLKDWAGQNVTIRVRPCWAGQDWFDMNVNVYVDKPKSFAPTNLHPSDRSLSASPAVTFQWQDNGMNNGAACPDFKIRAWQTSDGAQVLDNPFTAGNSLNWAAPRDGEYKWNVQAGNGWNSDPSTARISGDAYFVIDTVGPVPFLTGPAVSHWFNRADGPQSVTWGATDATSGVATKAIVWDNSATTNQIPEGRRTATVSATDNAGNPASLPFGPYWIDMTNPNLSSSISPADPDGENGWYKSAPVLTLTATDPNGADASGIAGSYCTIDGSESAYTTPVTIQDGAHMYTARTVDNAGNATSTQATALNVDSSAPTPPIITVPSTYASDSTLVASWKSDDPQSGVGKYLYRIGTTQGGSDVATGQASGDAPWAYVPNLNLTVGQQYYFTVSAKNNAGLWSESSNSSGILIVAPTSRDMGALFDVGGVSSGNDDGGVRKSTNYAICDSMGQFVVSSSSSTSYALDHGYWTSGMGDVKPHVTITSPTSSSSYSTGNYTINIGGSASDDKSVASVAWSNDRGGSGTCTGTNSWSASDIALTAGANTITVTATDVDGNQGSSTLSVTVRSALTDGNWWIFHHDPAHTGWSSFNGPNLPGKAWEFLTGDTVYSSPAVGLDGTVYVGSVDKKLYAFNPDGSEKWEFTTGNLIKSSPAIGTDGTVYVGSYDKKLYAFNTDGSKKWEFLTGNAVSSSPVIGTGGTIYVGSLDNKLYAINPDGSKRWIFATSGQVYSSPAIAADGTLYVGSLDGSLYAVNPDGTKKWQCATGDKIYSSPSIGNDGTVYVGSWDKKLYAINPIGTKLWEFVADDSIYSSPAIGNDGTIYVGSLDHKVYAIHPDGSKKWDFLTGNLVYSSPAVDTNGTVYVGSYDKKLYAINPDGTNKWSYLTGGAISSSPAIGPNGRLYFGSLDKKLYAVGGDWRMFHHDPLHTGASPFNGSDLSVKAWDFLTGDRVYSSVTVGPDGTIYAGSNDKKLYAVNPDGTKRWEFLTGSQMQSTPAVGLDGTVYAGSLDHKVYAVNPDGTKKWSYTTGGAVSSSPTLGLDGTLYVGSWDNKLYSLGADGTKKWTFATSGALYSSPALATDGTLYVGSLDGGLYAVKSDGTKKWEFITGDKVYSSPAIGKDGTVYVGSYDKKLYAINPDGSKKWEFLTGNSIYSSPAVASDGTIYIGSFDNKLYAVTPAGTEKWEFLTKSVIYSSPAIGSDGTIYVGSYDSNIYAINPDGTKKGAYKVGDAIYASPAIGSDGMVYVGSVDKKLYAFGPGQGANPTVLVTKPTTSLIYSSNGPVISIGGTASGYFDITKVAWSNARGGNGTCSGTASWSANNLALQVGRNLITVTATDSAGKQGSSTLTVNYADSISPLVKFNFPVSTGSYDAQGSALDIGGTATDNVGVTSVTWMNSRGGSGTCTGTDAWSAFGISLQPGINVITVIASDAVGNMGTASLAVRCDNSTWWMFHHDAQHTGLSPFTGPSTAAQEWQFTTGGFVYSSPVIDFDGTVYAGSLDGKLYAMNSNGTSKWVFTTGGCVQSTPAIGQDGTVYVGSDDRKLYAINPNGTMKWSFLTQNILRSSATVAADGTVYFGSIDTKVYAINPNGTKKWTFVTSGQIYSTPAVGSDGTVYIGSLDGSLYAINSNGTKKWQFATGDKIFSSPTVGTDGTIYVGSWDKKLYAVNPDGTKKWEFLTGDSIYSSPAIGPDGMVYVGSFDRKLYAIDSNGAKSWEYLTGNMIYSSPAIDFGGTIYIGSYDKMLHAVNGNGTKKWTLLTGMQSSHLQQSAVTEQSTWDLETRRSARSDQGR